MKSKNKKWIGIGIGLAGIALIGALFVWNQTQKSEMIRNASIVKVKRGNIDVKLVINGTVTPRSCVSVYPPMAGRIESMGVAEGDYVLRGRPVGVVSSAERAALLDAAATRGKEERKKWEDVIKPALIIVPVSGKVIRRNGEPGQTVTPETELLTICDRLIVRARLTEDDIAKIQMGQSAEVTVDAIAGMRIKAKVEKLAFHSKLVNNIHTYEIDLAVPDLPANVLSGMGVSITFTLAKRTNVLLLPLSAVRETTGIATVQLADDEEGTRRVVETGLQDGQMVEIVSGLSEAQAVIDDSKTGGIGENKAKNPIMNSYKKN